jgi:hypothetical protein
MAISSILLKKLHILSLKDNSANYTISIKFDFGIEKTYKFIPETFNSLIEDKEKMKSFIAHTSKYEMEKYVEITYELN